VYELFDHTADIGLRVVAPDRATLFREAAQGLFAVIVEQGRERGTTETIEFALEAGRDDFLFVDWLNELLYLFEVRRLLLDSFEVALRGTRLQARARARPFDEERDIMLREVKAVTYHGLRVERTAMGWLAEVVLDI